MRRTALMVTPTGIDAYSLWLLLRSLETEIIGLCVTMTTQLSERSLSGLIAFLASGVRSPRLDWNGMYDHCGRTMIAPACV